MVCRFAAADAGLLGEVAEAASRLASARLGLDMGWGVAADLGEGAACWVEYFPGGLHPACIQFTVQALQAAFAAAIAARSGDAADQRAADRERALLDDNPAKDIFVQSRFLIAAARHADIPVHDIGGSNVGWQFGWGSRSDLFFMTASLGDSIPGHQLTWKKQLTKQVLLELGLPTPQGCALGPGDDAVQAAYAIGWPCVVKPVDQAFGIGVTANLQTPGEVNAAAAMARHYSHDILIEAHEAGADYRLMVVDGRLIAAVRRDPPAITGDGQRTIAALLAQLNAGRDGTRAKGYLLPVEADAALAATLASQHLTMSSVLPTGDRLALRSIANFSTGGSAVDVTDRVHPQVRGMAELLATAVGLRTAGIDYITTDITRGHAEVGGGFIEVNAMPRLRLLMLDGRSEEEIGTLVLGERPGRIPVTLIVGSGDALAELEAPARQWAAATPGAAAAGASGVQVGATPLPAAGLSPFTAVAAALRHRAVETLLILWSADDLALFGMPVDQAQRIIVIDKAVDAPWLSDICPDVVAVKSAAAALKAALG
ncbi:MAG: hypothetical protein ABIT69_07800 [Sphingomicrobium sp.]